MDQIIVDNYRDLVIIKESDLVDAFKNAPKFPSSEQEPICTSITKVRFDNSSPFSLSLAFVSCGLPCLFFARAGADGVIPNAV